MSAQHYFISEFDNTKLLSAKSNEQKDISVLLFYGANVPSKKVTFIILQKLSNKVDAHYKLQLRGALKELPNKTDTIFSTFGSIQCEKHCTL